MRAGQMLSDECGHDSANGVDQAPDGPEKVWRCAECGWLFRIVDNDYGTYTLVAERAGG